MEHMSPILYTSISTILAIAATAVLAVFLLGSATYYAFIRKSRIILLAIFLVFTLLIYVGGFAAYTFSAEQEWVDFFNRLCYTGATAVPFFFLLFIQEIIGRQRPPMIITYAAVTSALIAALWLDRTYLITGTMVYIPHKGYYSIVTGPLFNVFIIVIFAAIPVSYARLFVYFLRNPHERKGLLPLVAGFTLWIALSVFDGFVSAGIIPTMPPIPWAGPVILALIISAYLGILFDKQYRQLKTTLNEKQTLREKLIQSQKMEAIGTLAGGLAHDFNNVLSAIIGSAGLLELVLKEQDLRQKEEIFTYIETINSASARAADMVRQLMGLSRKQELKTRPMDLNRSLENIHRMCKNTFSKNIRISFRQMESPAIVYADPTQIEQSILNLCVNAAHSMTIMKGDGEREGGMMQVTLEQVFFDAGFRLSHPEAKNETGYYSISVRDDGVGMGSDTISRIFEPFFTTKGKGRGTGLGLAMVYNIITQHGGFIDVISEHGTGTCMILYLPRPPDREALPSDDG